MFPRAGYFRKLDCPFFISGGCKRPYCHFNHSKRGYDVARNSLSKPLKEGSAAEQGDASDVKISFYSQNDKESSTAKSDHHTPKSILKAPGSIGSSGSSKEQNVNHELPSYVPSSASYSLAAKEHLAASARPDNDKECTADKNTVADDGDDTDPITDLTEEEKNIVFSGVSKSLGTRSNRSNEGAVVKVGLGSAIKEACNVSKTTAESFTKDDGTTERVIQNSSKFHTGNQPSPLEKHGKEDTSQVEALNNLPDNESIISHEEDQTVMREPEEPGDGLQSRFSVKEKKRRSTAPTGSEKYRKKKKRSILKEKAEETPATSELDIEKQKGAASEKYDKSMTSNVSNSEAKPKAKDKVMVSDVDFFSKPNTSKSSKATRNSKCIEKGSSKKPEKKMRDKSSAPKNLKCKEGNPTKKSKVEMRDSSFAQLNDKLDTKKRTCDAHRTETSVLKEKSSTDSHGPKQQKLKDDVTEISSEDDAPPVWGDETPVFSMSDSEEGTSDSREEAELKRIFDAYQPKHPKEQNEPIQVPCHEAPKEKHFLSDAVTPKKGGSMVDKLGLGQKRRVAHDASYLPRRISLNANPIRRYPKIVTAVRQAGSTQGTPPSVSSPSASPGGVVTASHKPAKRRIAHTPKAPVNKTALARPQIVVEYGAKVPRNQRQQYLERIIDENLRLFTSQEAAYKKASEEEKSIYDRATRRQLYVNLCINLIKKLRSEPALENSAAATGLQTEQQESGSQKTATQTTPRSSTSDDAASASGSVELTEEALYESLAKYILNDDDLVENGYPRPSPTKPGTAMIKRRKPLRATTDPSRRTCARCGKSFVIVEDQYQRKEQCVYHYGRLWRRRSAGEVVASFNCCQGDAGSTGCCVAELHVSENLGGDEGFMTTIVNPLADKGKKVFGLDCEMCYTTAGLELTRATVVDWKLDKVYDTFVKPDRPIVDYNTRFSGVTEELMFNVTTSLREVQAVLLSIIHKGSILVGHSLESDLTTVKLIHSNIVDTSVVFPHRRGPPYKRALRTLMGEYLKKIIQANEGGHDSFEDAAAALELMRWKVMEDKKVGKRRGSRSSV